MRRVLIWSGNAVSKVTFMETPHRPLIEHLSLLSAVSIKKVISFQILMMFYVIGPDPPTVKMGKETKPASLSVFRFLAQRAGKVFSLRFQLVFILQATSCCWCRWLELPLEEGV